MKAAGELLENYINYRSLIMLSKRKISSIISTLSYVGKSCHVLALTIFNYR
jgi:hypothetical protein